MDIVTRLEAARNQTLGYFDLSNEQLDRNYGAGKWSPVRFILHHLADAETVLNDRIWLGIGETIGRPPGPQRTQTSALGI